MGKLLSLANSSRHVAMCITSTSPPKTFVRPELFSRSLRPADRSYGLDIRLSPGSEQRTAPFSANFGRSGCQSKDHAVVVLVDALDEAEDIGLARNRQPPITCRVCFPDDVYCVTSREQWTIVSTSTGAKIYIFGIMTRRTRGRAYVRPKILESHPETDERIAGWKVSREEFVEFITERSEGNFMYLVHVLEDIRAGILSADSIDRIQDLPKGLREYYQRHWRTMRAHDVQRFESVYEPVYASSRPSANQCPRGRRGMDEDRSSAGSRGNPRVASISQRDPLLKSRGSLSRLPLEFPGLSRRRRRRPQTLASGESLRLPWRRSPVFCRTPSCMKL